MESNSIRVGFSIDLETHHDFKVLCTEKGTNMSDLLRSLIADYIAETRRKQRQQLLRRKGSILGEAAEPFMKEVDNIPFPPNPIYYAVPEEETYFVREAQ